MSPHRLLPFALTLLLASLALTACGDEGSAPDGPELLSPAEVNQELEAGAIVLADVRGASSWQTGRLPGAMHLPLSQTDALRIGTTTRIVAYCGAGNGPAEDVADALGERGYSEVYVLDGGYQAWVEAGYEVERDEVD